jgi:acetylornithine deacetylase/succinyl-diaminopimelate desuccinylase-like protein
VLRRPIALAFVLAASLSPACADRGGGQGRRTSAPADSGQPPHIDEPWMIAQVDALSDDALAGRYTLNPETLQRAGDMIAAHHREIGSKPVGESYRVPFEFGFGSELIDAHHLWLETGGPAQPVAEGDMTTLTLGGGRTVVAEVVLVQGSTAKLGPAKKDELLRGRAALLVDPKVHANDDALRGALEALKAAGVEAVLLASSATGDRARRKAIATEVGLPTIELAPNAVASIAGRAPKKPSVVKLAAVRVSMAPRSTEKQHTADNVVAWMPGSERPNELVVLGAHYDHIGTTENGLFCRASAGDTICNGADDNASGTAMVLAIAKAFADSGHRPKRTLVFAHFAGEELGLHGSRALADSPPTVAPFAGGRIVAMVNFDMVGRLGKEGLSIGGVGSSAAWMPLLDRVGTHGLPIVYERSISARSDQASFYAHDVPVLFFFTGLHPDYHGPDDEIGRLARPEMGSIAALALDIVVALADGESVPFAKAKKDGDGLVGRIPGTDEATVEKRVGLPAKGK